MYKVSSILIAGAVLLSLFLFGCDTTEGPESSTENEPILEAVDRSAPVSPGNLIMKTSTDSDGNININYYDNADNLVESFVWQDDSLIGHTVMQYNSDDLLQLRESIDENGETTKSTAYQYNAQGEITLTTENEFTDGLLSKSSVYDGEGNMTAYSLSYYNDSQRLSKIERYTPDDKMSEYYMYEYNEGGSMERYSLFDPEGVLQRYTLFSYNESGSQAREEYFDGEGNLESYYLTSYYDSGAIKARQLFDSEGKLLSEESYEDTTMAN